MRTALRELHAVARADIDLELTHAVTQHLGIPRIAQGQPADACIDAGPRFRVLEALEPFLERSGLQDLEHGASVIPSSQLVNHSSQLAMR